MNAKINILLIEDTNSHREFILSCLSDDKFYVETSATGKDAIERLVTDYPFFQVVLVDYLLPDFTGIEVIEQVNKSNRHYAFIFITLNNSLETVLKAMRVGARDFILKNNDLQKYLIPTIERVYHDFAEKQVRVELQKHLNTLSAGVEQSGSIIFITDLNGKIEYVNKKFTQVTGYKSEDVIGRHTRILKSGNKPKSFYEELWFSILSGQNWKGELSNRKKNGELYYVESSISSIKDENGTVLKFMAVQEDITEKRLLMNKLQEKTIELNFEKLQLEKIIDTIPNPIFVKNAELKYTLCNKCFATSIMGKEKNEIIGKTVYEISPPELADVYFQSDIKFKNEKVNYQEYESKARYADGSIHEVLLYKSALLTENGDFDGIVGIILDISERNRNMQLIQNYAKELRQINIEKDRFLSIMAHDLKNSFNLLMGFSALLQKNWRKYGEVRIDEQLQIINTTAASTFDLLEDLLLWSKAQSGNLPFDPQPIELESLCKSVIETLKPAWLSKNLQVYCELDQQIQAMADLNMMKTVLRNLIQNAIKFTPNKGQIKVIPAQENNSVKISVSDTGMGIPDDVKQKLWDMMQPFSSSGTEGETGTGLGLILCKELIDKHGGRIWVESEPGKGSVFSFTVPSI